MSMGLPRNSAGNSCLSGNLGIWSEGKMAPTTPLFPCLPINLSPRPSFRNLTSSYSNAPSIHSAARWKRMDLATCGRPIFVPRPVPFDTIFRPLQSKGSDQVTATNAGPSIASPPISASKYVAAAQTRWASPALTEA